MTKRIISALLAVFAVTVLLAPSALAASEDKGLDEVLVAADGTVTLVSGHMADEEVSSAQLKLEVEPIIEDSQITVSFAFGSVPEGSLKKSSVSGNTLSIYVAGTEALMAEGQTQLTLGVLSVSDGAMVKVSLVKGSLQYVYGRELIAQNAENVVSYVNISAEALQSLVKEAEALEPGDYSNSSFESLQKAIADAKALLENSSASAESLAQAYQALSAAMSRLEEKNENEPSWETRQALEDAIESASALRRDDYSEGFDELQSALEAARAALNDPTKNESELQAAIAALASAMDALVEKPAQGPGDPGSIPEGKPGPDESAPSPSPTAPLRATPRPSPSPKPSTSPSPRPGASPSPGAGADGSEGDRADASSAAPAAPVPAAEAETAGGISVAVWILLALLLVLAGFAVAYWYRRRR